MNTPAQSDTLAVYDQAAALEYAGGDTELAAELMSTLLAGLPEEIESLRVCLAEADWPGLAEYAHQIRGATSYCGVPALDTAIADLERAARALDALRCEACFHAAEREAQRLREHMV